MHTITELSDHHLRPLLRRHDSLRSRRKNRRTNRLERPEELALRSGADGVSLILTGANRLDVPCRICPKCPAQPVERGMRRRLAK